MKYLGGKSRLAKDIAKAISPRGYWWDPFCGGLSVSTALSKYSPGLVSDLCLPLISLYESVESGWEPPVFLSREEWERAKMLPDTDPLKAFAGFGCSVQALWFQAYYPAQYYKPTRTHPNGMNQNPAAATTASLKRDIALLKKAGCSFAHFGFYDLQPDHDIFESVYCDPPYSGTVGYAAVSSFDHDRFWSRAQEWAHFSRVFVSEFSCPVPHEIVWSKLYEKRLGTKGQSNAAKLECLFRVLAP